MSSRDSAWQVTTEICCGDRRYSVTFRRLNTVRHSSCDFSLLVRSNGEAERVNLQTKAGVKGFHLLSFLVIRYTSSTSYEVCVKIWCIK